MNENANVFEEIEMEEVAEISEEIAESSNGFAGIIVSGAVIAVGALVGVAYKKKAAIKNWNNNRKIKKLEKQGFIVTAPEVPVETEEDASREDETK